MTRETDQNLPVEIHRGNRKAMEQLIRLYEDKLFTYACYMMRQEEEAKDILQEAFIKAHMTLTVRYDESTCRTLAVQAWLFQIVRNIALNRMRSNKRRHKAHEGLVNQQKTGMTSMKDHAGTIEYVLQNLDQDSRELITLRFIEDLSYAEIVSIAGTTESAIRGKIYRALCKIRKLMEEE